MILNLKHCWLNLISLVKTEETSKSPIQDINNVKADIEDLQMDFFEMKVSNKICMKFQGKNVIFYTNKG